MNPLTRIDARLDKNKWLVQEAIELLEWAFFFLKEDIALELRTEDNFVTTYETEICQSNHVGFAVNEGHQLDFSLQLFWAALAWERFGDLLDKEFVNSLDQLEMSRQYFLENLNRPFFEVMVCCYIDGAAVGIMGRVPSLLPNQLLVIDKDP
jgi:hypothetical protein